MSHLTEQQQTLISRWDAIFEGAGEAISWVEDVREDAPSLDSEADNLILELRRAKNLASALGQASSRPMTIGFFGLSQAGKSYLISALAAGQNGKLETNFSGSRLDFLHHVNPAGGGKEATGLVTRFSRSAVSGPTDTPVELRLFREIEIVKILANSWFNDFDHERLDFELDATRIDAALSQFESVTPSTQHQPGMTAEDVVSLWDYLRDSYGNSIGKLRSRYWPRAILLAPRLKIAQRAELFALLWGEQSEFTRLYQTLASVLANLNYAPRVYAPLACLVSKEGGAYVQRDSIMNVDILERLGAVDEPVLEVCPDLGADESTSVSVPVAQLAALAAELIFPLVEPTQDPHVEKVDLLDFPGYRGRMKLTSLEPPQEQAQQDGMPVAKAFLRGKVAYLFERYTDTQEMNGLVVCTSSDKQSDVSDVEPVLTRWIENTQGLEAVDREGKDAGLIWAITMFDKRVSSSLGQEDAMLSEGWEGLIKMTLLERFGGCDWLDQWSPSRPFDNVFLVRKPGIPVPFLDTHQGHEKALREDSHDALQRMAKTFTASDKVNRHVANPDDAWQAMLTLNDGGIKRISAYLGRIATLDFKLQRIEQQLQDKLEGLVEQRLEALHHRGGSEDEAAKREIAKQLWQKLKGRLAVLGELQAHLGLPTQTVRDLYLSDSEHLTVEPSDDDATLPNNDSLYAHGGFSLDEDPFTSDSDDIFGDAPPAQDIPVLEGADHRFSRKVFQAWVAHLRELPERHGLLRLLGLEHETVTLLTSELIQAAHRLQLQMHLDGALLGRAQSSARRDQLVERQVLTAQLVLSDFVSWLGYQHEDVSRRPKSLVGEKQPLFMPQHSPLSTGELPRLAPQPVNHAVLYLSDWLSGICYLVQDNAGHSAGREITLEQNDRLGLVLARFRQKEMSHAG